MLDLIRQRQIFARGDALVPVGIQSDAEQRGFAFGFFGVCHLIQRKARVQSGQAAGVMGSA